jgi:phosphatidate cytidylyltransferase
MAKTGGKQGPDGKPAKSSDLGRRVAVAAVGIPLGVLLVWAGGWPLAGVIALLAALGTSEVFGLAEARGWRPFPWIGIPASVLLVLWAQASGSFAVWAGPAWAILLVGGLGALAAAVFRRGPGGDPLPAVGSTLFGIVYVGGTLAFAVLLRSHPAAPTTAPGWEGTFLLIFTLTVTWLGDSFAYFGGRAFGKRKLLPSVSPAKTVEGGISGLLGSMAGAALFTTLALPWLGGGLPLTVAAAALLGLLISAVAQVGDLAESLLKREAGVKDSGRILPGHGGVLDRFDAVLFTLPLVYVLLPLFLGWGS